MKILVNGAAGHMGRIVVDMTEKGLYSSELAAKVDAFGAGGDILASLDDFTGECDCIIDFSHHAATKTLTEYAVKKNLPLVLCTTGQTEEEKALIAEASKKIPLFFAANMSLGIAVLTNLVKQAVKMFPGADIEIVEQHHNRKLDVPSGTALTLAKAVQAARPEAELLVGRHENGKRTPNEVGIHSLRMGNVVGIHEVIINTGTQILSLKHEAQDRGLFAEGALAAAAFLMGKPAGHYDMEDLMSE